jgi:hypothetical protein
VVQLGGGAGLPEEPLQPPGRPRAFDREQLQGDVLAQRLVDRLVDHAHAAAADLAHHPVVAEDLADAVGLVPGRAVGLRPGEAFQHQQRREQGADALGQRRVAGGVVLDRWQLAAAHPRRELLRQPPQQ